MGYLLLRPVDRALLLTDKTARAGETDIGSNANSIGITQATADSSCSRPSYRSA